MDVFKTNGGMSNMKIAQRGFTMVELVVVMIGIGILIALLAPNFGGTKDEGMALLLDKSAQTIAGNWVKVAQLCGTTTDVNYSPVPAAGNTVADVLFNGSASVNSSYAGCYAQAHVNLAEMAQGSTGSWKIGGYPISFSGGGTVAFCSGFTGVPDSIVLMLAQRYNNALQTLAASDSTSRIVQYSVASNGTRTVSVCHQAG